jgi:hypothetical protein
LAFLFTFTVTLVALSGPDNPVEWRSIRDVLRNLMEGRSIRDVLRNLMEGRSIRDVLRNLMDTIRRKVEPLHEIPQPLGRLSDETWRRVLLVHMINAAPDRRM